MGTDIKERKPGKHKNNLMRVNTVLACNHFCLFWTLKTDPAQDAIQIPDSHNDLNQEDVTALGHHGPQVCAVGDHLPHHEPSNCAVSDLSLLCNLPVCAVADHVLPESKEEQVEKPLEPTQQELVVIASEGAGFSNTVDDGQFFRTRAGL